MTRHTFTAALVLGALTVHSLAAAQAPPPPAPTEAGAPAAATDATGVAVVQDAIDDAVLNPAQPDFTLVGLPTTLRLPRGAWSFRVTHRFARPLGMQGTRGFSRIAGCGRRRGVRTGRAGCGWPHRGGI